MTGCSLVGADEDSEKKEDELGSIMPMYGMPPPLHWDASTPVHVDAGPAPVDAGPAPCDDINNIDNGGMFAMYGMPPPISFDASAPVIHPCPVDEDAGTMHAMYGMPPP